jgi:uncharacterized protein YdaT
VRVRLVKGKMMTKNRKQQHVVPHGDGWGVKRSGSSRVTKKHNTQRDAIDHAKSIAENQKTEVVIHRRDGSIRDKDSYGNDPFPPRDRKH